MEIWEINKLILFIIFVIPGFISLKTYSLLVPTNNDNDTSKLLIDAIAYSSINYAILSIPIMIIEKNNISTSHPYLYIIFYFFVLFIFPIIFALLWQWLRNLDLFQDKIPHPTLKPWDYIFSQRKPYWVKIKLKNGEVIGGKYAENSFSSSFPAKEQIYLEETWIIKKNGGFKRPKNMSDGIIVMSDEISYIELIKYE